jgi:hypothetical protein
MRVRSVWITVLALAFAVTLAAVDFGDRTTTIDGHVYIAGAENTPRPLAGATIATNQGLETTVTDDQGKFTLRIRRIASDEFVVVTAWAPGKIARQRTVVGYSPIITMDLVLE